MSFALLVNTTDAFEDCWLPYFSLFQKYWASFDGKIYLNTEEKIFRYKDLNIISIQNGGKNKTWSECLREALNFIEEDNIIYMQDDYFLCNFVNHNKIYEFYRIFQEHDLDCLHLTDQASPGPFLESCIRDVKEIAHNAPYRLSTQAAFWKKTVLADYIRDEESGWQFEIIGNKRVKNFAHKLFCVDPNKYGVGKEEIVPYIFTGIIKGRWHPEVPELFKDNDIVVDYEVRGMHQSRSQHNKIMDWLLRTFTSQKKKK